MLGFVGIAVGLAGGLWGGLLFWFGLAMLFIGASYAFPRHFNIFRKTHGKLGWIRKLLLFPYLVLQYGTWHILRRTSTEAPFVELVEGIWIGRRLLLTEYPPIKTLVDLTSELDEHIPYGANLLAFPVLDGAPVEPSRLRRMAREIAIAEKPIYIHCAQGHGRTSMVAAAVLLEMGAAHQVVEALELIRAVRPGAKPNLVQRRALEAAFAAKE